MDRHGRVLGVRILYLSLSIVSVANGFKYSGNSHRRGPDDCKPIVVAHRGASGYASEHTLGSYALAVTMGADYVEPDLVMTKDGYLIARHENELARTTDVAERPEFTSRRRTQIVSGKIVTGWFSEDFTLEEIKTLRAMEAFPNIRKGNVRMDKAYEVPTFQEIIDLVKALEMFENRTIGIYPELKYGAHFQNIGLAMEEAVVDIFHKNGYFGREAPAYIQSFEVSNLKKLTKITNVRLLQLLGARANRPYDQVLIGSNLTYADMATPSGLAAIATYASAVGPDKSYVIPRNLLNNLQEPTSFVEDAHKVGLQVHPYTFRAENSFLPREFQIGLNIFDLGDQEGEIRAFLKTGIDGLFVDHPDILVRIRGPC